MGYRVKPSRLLAGIAPASKRAKTRSKAFLGLPDDDQSIEDKVEKLFSGEELLFERLHSEPKWTSKAYKKAKVGAVHASVFVRKAPLVTRIALVIVPALAIGGTYWRFQGGSEQPVATQQVNEVAGVTDDVTEVADSPVSTELVTPTFSMLLPKGKSEAEFRFAKVSPDDNAPTYAFNDLIDGKRVTVSEQEVPKQFDYNRAVELERVAKDFQATNVIQIDEDKIYHGYSEKLRVQSLVFIKKDRLIFIKSPEKLTDDVWTGYILNLQ